MKSSFITENSSVLPSFSFFSFVACVIIFSEGVKKFVKLSAKWLKNFVSLDNISLDEVISKLTMGAFEVEDVQKIGPKLKGPILVGKILDIKKHPNAIGY